METMPLFKSDPGAPLCCPLSRKRNYTQPPCFVEPKNKYRKTTQDNADNLLTLFQTLQARIHNLERQMAELKYHNKNATRSEMHCSYII